MKSIRNIWLLFTIIIIGFNIIACSKSIRKKTVETHEVIDMAGNKVELPKTIERVFVDWGSGFTLIMTLGATNKLVTVPTAFLSGEMMTWLRIICPSIELIEANDRAFTNIEVALSYYPDIIITNTKDNIQKYTDLGATAIYVYFTSHDSFKESMKIIGEALGEEYLEVALKYNKLFDEYINMVTERTNLIADVDRPSVYYVDGRFPNALHTVGVGEIQESWISYAGGNLSTKGYFTGRDIEITIEQFLVINPDIIFIGATRQAEAFDSLINHPILSQLNAVKNSRVYRIPQGIFPWCRTGPEAAIHTVWAAKQLHPNLFEDIDIAKIAKDFYREFFGTDISDYHLQGILKGQLSPDGK